MIRFFESLNDLAYETVSCESCFGRMYLDSILTHIKRQPLRGFAVNVGTQTFFAVTGPHHKIPWLLSYKMAKQFVETFRQAPWTVWRLTMHIRNKARKAIIDLNQYSEDWIVYGDETIFYEFRDIWMVADA